MRTFAAVALLSAFTLSAASAHAVADSVYSSLLEADCVVIELEEEHGWSLSECPAFAGYRVVLEDGDARQSLSIVDRHGQTHALDFSRTVTGAFSALGAKLEWRFRRSPGQFEPYALIVRVDGEDVAVGAISWLAVIRLVGGEICVVDRIGPSSEQNLSARIGADEAAGKACRD